MTLWVVATTIESDVDDVHSDRDCESGGSAGVDSLTGSTASVGLSWEP